MNSQLIYYQLELILKKHIYLFSLRFLKLQNLPFFILI